MNPLVRLILVVVISTALAAALTLSLVRGSGIPASTLHSRFFGVDQRKSLARGDFHMMAAAGVQTDRFLLFWGTVQPRPRSFVWGPVDDLVGAFASHGIQPFPSVIGNPDWIPGGFARPPLATSRARGAWRTFLKALVNRYGPSGAYWAHAYRKQYGSDATAMPIRAWQIWNEPNLNGAHFAPQPSAAKYARLVRIAHDAVKREDTNARIVLGGMPGNGQTDAWTFLDELYRQPGFRASFDIAALQPYGRNVDEVAEQIRLFRAAINNHSGRKTPLWITELGWGSGAPHKNGLTKGPVVQARMLTTAFKMILRHRRAWNVRRLYWFDWRDPRAPRTAACTFCATAGLLNYDHSRKPAYFAFKRLTRMSPTAWKLAASPRP